MNKLISKLLISFLAGITILLSFPLPALAQTAFSGNGPWYNQTPAQWIGKVFGGDQNEIFGERYTYAQTQWITYSVIVLAFNAATSGKLTGCLTTLSTGLVGNCPQEVKDALSAIPNLSYLQNDKSNLFAQIFADRPISGITFVKDLGRKFHVIPEAKAQAVGFGYGALTFNGGAPEILALWTTMRDLSYAIFVVVIIAFAFMIMFRVKISPQVVISVQSALPKIAIGLVLVTFSFAIAGFLIDLMYVAIGIISLIFAGIPMAGIPTGGLNPAGVFDMLTKGPAFLGGGSGIFGLFFMYWINFFIATIVIGLSSLVAGWGCVPFFAALGGTILGFIIILLMFIALIVLLIIMVINFFKLIFLLAKTFLMIIILVIFAPLQLALGTVIPGLGFGAWVKALASKLAVFPVIGVMFVLSLALLHQGQQAVGIFNGFKCPANAWPAGWPPFIGGSPQMVALLFVVASLAVFVMMPKAGDMVEGFFAGKGFNLQSGIGEAGAVPAALGGAGLGALMAAREYQAKKDETSPFNPSVGGKGYGGSAKYAAEKALQTLLSRVK